MSAAVLRPATTNATEQVRDAMSLIKELKRRNVIRMAGLYLVGAWRVVEYRADAQCRLLAICT
jgi:hypothetical protein